LLELHKCKARCAETCFSSALGPKTEKQIQSAKNKIRFLGQLVICVLALIWVIEVVKNMTMHFISKFFVSRYSFLASSISFRCDYDMRV